MIESNLINKSGTLSLKQGRSIRATGALLSRLVLLPCVLSLEIEMNKDPAFLLYSKDFLIETEFLSNSQTGKYIKLLCYQHQKGHLPKKHMNKICGTYDKDIFCLFKTDSYGNYYSEWLEKVMQQRRAYRISRARNRMGKNKDNISSTYENHIGNGTGNGDLLKEGEEFITGVDL